MLVIDQDEELIQEIGPEVDAAVAALAKVPGVAIAYPDIGFPAMVGLDASGGGEFRLVQVVPAAVAGSRT